MSNHIAMSPAPDRFHAGRVRWAYSVIELDQVIFFVAANPNKKSGVHAIAKGGNELSFYSSRDNFLHGLPIRTAILKKPILTLGGLVDEMEDEEFMLTTIPEVARMNAEYPS